MRCSSSGRSALLKRCCYHVPAVPARVAPLILARAQFISPLPICATGVDTCIATQKQLRHSHCRVCLSEISAQTIIIVDTQHIISLHMLLSSYLDASEKRQFDRELYFNFIMIGEYTTEC